jgi:hypothetical protein
MALLNIAIYLFLMLCTPNAKQRRAFDVLLQQ